MLEAQPPQHEVEGGVLADVMGGGKTATTIALISRSCEENRSFQKLTQLLIPILVRHTRCGAPTFNGVVGDRGSKVHQNLLSMIVIDTTQDLLQVTKELEADIVAISMSILIDGSGEFGRAQLEKKLESSSEQGTYYVFVKFVEEGRF